jgi:hypothetical protein
LIQETDLDDFSGDDVRKRIDQHFGPEDFVRVHWPVFLKLSVLWTKYEMFAFTN